MAEVQIAAPARPAPAAYDRQGWWKCRFCRSKNPPTARDGGSADFAGAKIRRPPGKAEVPIPYGTSIGHAIHGNNVGNNYLPTPHAQGVRRPRRRARSAAIAAGFSTGLSGQAR
ncbi:hypothetical protein [Candidatus Spongiihabitans sp.]|uniref:hypothetical protein n=1 Tax=Candidatus Spongiihabitans sp. TaxID=3101308 RepID=UPI003C798811